MTQDIEVENESYWRKFVKRHSRIFAIFIAAAIMAAVGAVYVFAWFTGNAQSTGLVPSTLGSWTMASIVMFILHDIFWELILIGIPVAIGAIIGWQWWKRLPDDERKEHLFGKGSRPGRAGGAISPLLFIAFAFKVYVDGNWNVAVSSYKLDYVVGSMITILVWIVAIFAIPAIIALIWWVRHR